jgi:dipeptide/tripeptide permease
MVNVGASFGPIIAGKLRAVSWNYAFLAAAIGIVVMLFITIFFYKEPEREISGTSLGQKLKDIGIVLLDLKFSSFLFLLGVFFWLPFWAFFNLCAVYVDSNVDTAQLYETLNGTLGAIPLIGPWLVGVISHRDDQGVMRVLGESISHTGYIIMVLQVFISRFIEKFRAMPSFMTGLFIAAVGFVVLGAASIGSAALVFLGIFLFAIGEMISSPRIQEYITWIAPKEKAGLYMGTNFLAVMVGAMCSGGYTWLSGRFNDLGHSDWVWYVLAGHVILAIAVFQLFTWLAGEFTERDA